MKNPIFYNICLSQLLKATVTKSWCLKQLNMFWVSDKRYPRTNQADGRVWEDYCQGMVRQR